MKKIALVGKPLRWPAEKLRKYLAARCRGEVCQIIVGFPVYCHIERSLKPNFPAIISVWYPSYAISHQFALPALNQHMIEAADEVIILRDSDNLYSGHLQEKCEQYGKPFTLLEQ